MLLAKRSDFYSLLPTMRWQDGETIIEILSSGKVVAVLSPPPPEEPAGTSADWRGSGAGTVTLAPGYDPDEPSFAPEEWKEF